MESSGNHVFPFPRRCLLPHAVLGWSVTGDLWPRYKLREGKIAEREKEYFFSSYLKQPTCIYLICGSSLVK